MTEPIEPALYAKVVALVYESARLIDDNRWEDWAALFTPDGVYKIVSRENVEDKLPLGIVYCDSRDMISDRILSLRKANIYNLHYDRHMVTNVLVTGRANGVLSVQANYAVYQSTPSGETALFSVGKYTDKIILDGEAMRFKERIVVADTGAVKNLISSPI